MSKLETNTIDTVSGTSTLQVGSTNTSTITLGVSGDTINVPSGVTINNNGTQTGFGGTNTPAFRVRQTSDQSIANDTATKLTSLVEDYDTASAFASNKFTVPSGEGGKYHFAIQLTYRTGDDIQFAGVQLHKNGSNIFQAHVVNNDYNDAGLVTVQSASASDYFEVYAEHQQGGNQNVKLKEFSGFKIIE